MADLGQDVRYALRTLGRSPGFTAIVVLTLALGIGANTAIFSLFDQVLLRPLPVREPERLVVLDAPGQWTGSTHQHSARLTPISHPMFRGLSSADSAFDGVLAHFSTALHFGGSGEAESVAGDLVSGTYFPVLGLVPAAGRLLGPEDDREPGAHPVVVLGHGFWTRRFGGDPSAVGRTVRVNGHPMTVVGVAPAGFHGVEVGESIDVFVPLAMQAQAIPIWDRGIESWRARFLTAMARLRPGVSLAAAQAQVNVRYASLLAEDLAHVEGASEKFRREFLAKQISLVPGAKGTSELRGMAATPLLVLMGMVGLVLLIACANVANLLVARASARRREIAVRLALGASRGRLVRQLLVESVGLSLAGGIAGLAVARGAGGLLIAALPLGSETPPLSAEPDPRMAAFAVLLSLATGVAFGLLPALQATRSAVAPTLRDEAGSLAGSGGSLRLRKGLVVAQVALSLLLLVGAGLFTRSLANLLAQDPGFEPEHLLSFTVDPSRSGYPRSAEADLLLRLHEAVGAQPGVRAAALSELALMTNSDSSSTVRVEGYTPREDENMNPNFNGVGPGFFTTLGIPLVAGRDVTDADILGAPKVAVVNETFARTYFPGADPVGRRFGFGRRSTAFDVTIVGVVRDGKAGSLRETPRRFIYTPLLQAERLGSATVYVRTGIDPTVLGDRLRQVVRGIDPGLPVTDLETMRDTIRESLFVERLVAALSAAFGLLATLLAALGLYGVMSYAVARRTREIGIRVALGATRGAVLGLVFREVALLSACGIGLGLPGGYGLARLVESELFGLAAFDPLTFGIALTALLGAAALAGFVPAARATRVHPAVALRTE